MSLLEKGVKLHWLDLGMFGAPILAKHEARLTDKVVLSLETCVLECDLHA